MALSDPKTQERIFAAGNGSQHLTGQGRLVFYADSTLRGVALSCKPVNNSTDASFGALLLKPVK